MITGGIVKADHGEHPATTRVIVLIDTVPIASEVVTLRCGATGQAVPGILSPGAALLCLYSRDGGASGSQMNRAASSGPSRVAWFTIVALALLARSVGAETLTINRAWSWPISSPDERGLFDRLVREACARAGVQVVFQMLSAERSLRNADNGLDDGDGPRIEGLEALYPNLVRVPEALVVYDFVAFATDPTVTVEVPGDVPDPWRALASYDVGIVRGWKILEQQIRGVRSLTRVRTPRLLMTLLGKGRVDVVVFERLMGLALAREQEIQGLRVLAPALTTRPMFLYLHKRHTSLVPAIGAALRAMKADGTTQRIVAEVLAEAPAGEEGPP